MNVLSISSDPKVLDPHSAVSERLQLQRAQVEKFEILTRLPRESKVAAAWRMVREGRKGDWDVILTQDPFWLGHIGWHIKQKTGAKLQIQIHTDLKAQPLWKRVFARINLSRADSVRVVSEQIKKSLETLKLRAPITVLPIFVDVEPFKKLERKAHPQKTILWVGRFEDEKDPLGALHVLREVRNSVDAKLIMLGEGSLREQLQKDTAGLPVEFLGWKDPKPYLEVADVSLSTSRHESWGASIIEALAAGVPVVVPPEIGVAEEAGAIVAPRKELAEAVVKVLESGIRGELKIKLLSKEEWAHKWRESLPK